jgi:ribosomal-protein-alanine N-acetyltransferase
MTAKPHICWMLRINLPDVLAIEHVTHPEPWAEGRFLRHLRQRNCIGMVAEVGNEIGGFMVYTLQKDTLDVLRLAVRPDLVRLGIGRAMADKLKGKLSPGRRTALTLLADERLTGGHLFLRAQGFAATHVVPGWAEDGGDAYAFRFELPDTAGLVAEAAGRPVLRRD